MFSRNVCYCEICEIYLHIAEIVATHNRFISFRSCPKKNAEKLAGMKKSIKEGGQKKKKSRNRSTPNMRAALNGPLMPGFVRCDCGSTHGGNDNRLSTTNSTSGNA